MGGAGSLINGTYYSQTNCVNIVIDLTVYSDKYLQCHFVFRTRFIVVIGSLVLPVISSNKHAS